MSAQEKQNILDVFQEELGPSGSHPSDVMKNFQVARAEEEKLERDGTPNDQEESATALTRRGFSASEIKKLSRQLLKDGYTRLGNHLRIVSDNMWLQECNPGTSEVILFVIPNLPWRSMANLMGLAGYFHGNIINVGEIDFLVGLLVALILALQRTKAPDVRYQIGETLGYVTLALTLGWAGVTYSEAAGIQREKIILACTYGYASFIVMTMAFTYAFQLTGSLGMWKCCHVDVNLYRVIGETDRKDGDFEPEMGCTPRLWVRFVTMLRWAVGFAYLHVPLYLMSQPFDQLLPVVYWKTLSANATINSTDFHYADYTAKIESLSDNSQEAWDGFLFQTLSLDGVLVLYLIGKFLASVGCVRECVACICCVATAEEPVEKAELRKLETCMSRGILNLEPEEGEEEGQPNPV